VFFGWLVDFSLTLLLHLLLGSAGVTTFFQTPDLSNPLHWLFLFLFLFATAVGGCVAAWIANDAYVLHGLLVGITGILIGAVLNPGVEAVPRLFVISQIVGCGFGALGGYLAGVIRRRRA
jgi:putative membrane protein (TIGR04086 family)